MKAWRFHGAGEPLRLDDVDAPTAGVGDLIIEVEAAGLCHTDVGFLDGTNRALAFAPITLGHEIAGTVVESGPGAGKFAVGQRVAIPAKRSGPGVSSDGGFAERVVVSEDLVVPVPDTVSFEHAAVATDAGMASYHAVQLGGISTGARVGVIGLGGLGLFGAQFAIAMGAEVYAAEIDLSVWPIATEMGVISCVRDITELSDENLEMIIDFAGFGSTTAGAIEAVAPQGTVVQVGLGKEFATISSHLMVFKGLRYIGSGGGTSDDVLAVMDLIEREKVKPLVSTISFDEIAKGIDRLRRGEVQGRLVAVPH
jgi:2-desacetyl-2-hydroxyethyl bacteriochlorophyllide A dehydrogenase